LCRMINVSSNEILKEAYPIVKDKYSPEELAANMNELGNVNSSTHKRIKEKAKAHLVQRRKTKHQASD